MSKSYGQQILASAEWDGITNSLDNYDVAGKVLGDGVHLFCTGPNICSISELIFIAMDLTFSDPSEDQYVGFKLEYTLNNSSYTSILTETADANLPQIWDDTGNDTEDFAVGVPVYAFGFQLGTPANTAGSATFDVPAHALVKLSLGIYTGGSLTTNDGVDNFLVQITGRFN